MFFIDISEECGYSIENQISLFENIKTLFAKKPVVIVFTKIDLKKFEDLSPEYQDKLNQLVNNNDVVACQMSNFNGEGIFNVKDTACKLLIKNRLEGGLDNVPSNILKREEEFLKGVYVAMPKKLREDRPPIIPVEVLEGRKKLDRPTLKQIQETMGGAGVFNFPLQEHYMLDDPNWKFDDIPEIMDGLNVADFYDRDIEEKLQELEREEEMLLFGKTIDEFDEEDDPDLLAARDQIINKRALKKLEHKLKSKKTAFVRNIPLGDVEEALEKTGKPKDRVHDRFKKVTKPKPLSNLYAEGDEDNDNEGELWEEDNEEEKRREKSEKKMDRKLRSLSRSRSVGTKKELTENEKNMERLKQKIQKKWKNEGKKGEADRHIPTLMPKHLFQGKRGAGKADWR